jgi:serine protease
MKSTEPSANSPQAFESVFEGFAVWVNGSTSASTLQESLSSKLGSDWVVTPFGSHSDSSPNGFNITSIEHQLSIAEAWQISRQLKTQPDIVYAEPLFEVAISGRPDWNDTTLNLLTTDPDAAALFPESLIFREEPHMPESDDSEWSLNQMRILEAWARFFPDPTKLPGQGIVIGHPDTGYRPHPEILPNLLVAQGRNFLNNNPTESADATDKLERPNGVIFPSPGHGTATSSVIISPQGDQTPGNKNTKFVTGVAPGAKLIPLRVTYSVVLLGMMKLAQSIYYATDRGAHVISISLGGLSCFFLRSAIAYAQKNGVIVAAAAGNVVRFVVWPAAYDEVIAVAASNAKGETWSGSCRGKKVDITAPGASVWYAGSQKSDDPNVAYGIGQGDGTSFAVAAVAGIAALWLSYHDRQKLIEKYGVENIPALFNYMLIKSCNLPAGWDTNNFGAGIVDAEKLLATPLPDNINEITPPMLLNLEERFSSQADEMEILKQLFGENASEILLQQGTNNFDSDILIEENLAKLLGSNKTDLPLRLKEVGQELAFNFATNPDLYNTFLDGITQQETDGESDFLDSDNIQALREILMTKKISQELKQELQQV